MKIRYTDAAQLVPTAQFIYVALTQEEIDSASMQKYVSEFEGVKILGTLEPIESLSQKELKVGAVSFV